MYSDELVISKLDVSSIVKNKISCGVFYREGLKIFEEIDKALARGEHVEVSFKGIEGITIAFLGSIIDNIYKKYTDKVFNDGSVSFVDTDKIPDFHNYFETELNRSRNPKFFNNLVSSAIETLC